MPTTRRLRGELKPGFAAHWSRGAYVLGQRVSVWEAFQCLLKTVPDLKWWTWRESNPRLFIAARRLDMLNRYQGSGLLHNLQHRGAGRAHWFRCRRRFTVAESGERRCGDQTATSSLAGANDARIASASSTEGAVSNELAFGVLSVGSRRNGHRRHAAKDLNENRSQDRPENQRTKVGGGG